MSADRARITYDPRRKYREVIRQQGRVTLEADENEAERISTEASRLKALDVVGPCGSPDNGFLVRNITDRDFELAPGTIYVGGLRATAEQGVTFENQSEWIDDGAGTDWNLVHREPWAKRDATVPYGVFLFLEEREITAVEDPALREVALGGPDTAARTRLISRVLTIPLDGTDCDHLQRKLAVWWRDQGLDYQSSTAALLSMSRLQVRPVSDPAPASECDPPAASGYLGADNQLIRVQIVRFDPAKGIGTLLWGYNNASTLFRCSTVDAKTVRLNPPPISDEFSPRSGQVVQVSLPAALLGDDAYAAETLGWTRTLASAYSPSDQTVALPSNMPPVPGPFGTPGTPPLFVRLWEGELPFRLDTEVELPKTGLAVTISSESPDGSLHAGDYWCFAARPATAKRVYPERYLVAPQPPEGPRLWGCPLATLTPNGHGYSIRDCRPTFKNLVDLTRREPDHGGCCCVTVGPEQADDLQRIIDAAVLKDGGASVTIHLSPGEYRLPHPILLDRRHSGLVLEGCTGMKPKLVAGTEEGEFAYGLLLLQDAHDVEIRGIAFGVSMKPLPDELLEPFRWSKTAGLERPWAPRYGCAAIRAVNSSFTVEECAVDIVSVPSGFAFGILVQGYEPDSRVRVNHCRFGADDLRDNAVLAGVCLAPIWDPDEFPRLGHLRLSRLTVEGNEFTDLHAGVMVFGRVPNARISHNVSKRAHSSVLCFVYRPAITTLVDFLKDLLNDRSPDFRNLAQGLQGDHPMYPTLCLPFLLALGKLGKGLRARPSGAPSEDPRVVPASITLEGNQFDSDPTREGVASSGPAVVLWGTAELALRAEVTGNSVTNSSPSMATMAVALYAPFEITGNSIRNRSSIGPAFFDDGDTRGINAAAAPPPALVIDPIGEGNVENRFWLCAITGNTIMGYQNLFRFPRNEWKMAGLPETLFTWQFFNAVIPKS